MAIDNAQVYEIYKNRLLDMSGRNKLISFKLGSKGLDLYDFAEFDSLTIIEGETLHLTQKKFVDKFKNNEEEDDEINREKFKNYIKKLEKLNSENDANYRETGKRSLYMSYCFLSGKLYGDNVVKIFAPLFLIPIDIETRMTSFKITKTNEDILINRTILIAIMKTLKRKINLDSYELSEVNQEVLFQIINKIESIGPDILKSLDFTRFPKRPVDIITDRFTVYNHLVINNLNVSNFLFDDYERIGNDTNSSIENLLNEDVVLNAECEQLQKEYGEINLTNREMALISKLDTSQECAVYMAKKSNNLVIYGPPGTGKSETILNIISDNINDGKKILVVSEKKAAVNVIYNRLMELQRAAIMFDSSNIQLNDLKQEILQKLEPIYIDSERHTLEESLEGIENCYSRFNSIYDILNTKYKGRKISEWYGEKKIAEDELAIAVNVEELEYTLSKNKEIRKLFDIEYEHFQELLKKVEDRELIETFKIAAVSEDKLKFVLSLFEHNIMPKDLIFELYDIRDKRDDFRSNYTLITRNGEAIKTLTKEKENIPDIEEKKKEVNALEKEINENSETLQTIKENLIQYQKLIEKVEEIKNREDIDFIKSMTDSDVFKNDKKMLSIVDKIIVDYKRFIKINSNFIKRMLNKEESNELTDKIDYNIQMLKSEIDDIMINFDAKINYTTLLISDKKVNKRKIEDEIIVFTTRLQEIELDIKTKKNEIETAKQWINDEIEKLTILHKINNGIIDIDQYLDNIEMFIEIAKGFRENRERFKDLIVINKGLLGLYQFLYNQNLLEANGIKELLWKIYLDIQIDEIGIIYENELQNIRTYDDTQDKYMLYEKEYFKNTRKEILTKIINERKSLNKPQEYIRMERDFKKEITLKRRSVKLRQFVSMYFDIIQSYFPIILATPEAVSKYLPLFKDVFDIIIFDEASQLVIENALPSIYRGKKIIVVGDDKQLKPSAFFKTSMNIEDEIDMISEEKIGIDEMLFLPDSLTLLSLLDITKGKYNSVSLLFHYRSKFAELIDFSNAVFYKGQLKLAPNILRDAVNDSITRIKTNGSWIYNSNKAEAEKVVSLLKQIFEERQNNETIGIITFNAKQKSCIEETIEAAMAIDPDFRQMYLQESNRINDFEDESIFVKNIENVQGDERDIIIFSVGYSYSNNGRLPTSFGPLSQEGGENRLNVAISRAKKKIYLITSFEPEELNVDNAKNDGAKIFKDYLLYVKYISNKDNASAKALLDKYRVVDIIQNQRFDSPFEEQVYKVLVDMGYNVDTQVGAYGFRIDMAIYDEKKGQYVLGLECDGAAYHSSRKTKERDIARQAFLESRGWTIYRIWSTNWWKEQKMVIKRLKEAIDKALAY